MVVSPCYVLLAFASRTTRRRTASAQWFLQDLRWKVDTAPLFYACPGRKIQLQIHPLNLWKPVASCRPCVLSPHLRIASAPNRERTESVCSGGKRLPWFGGKQVCARTCGSSRARWIDLAWLLSGCSFFGLFSQFHDYNRNVISLRRHSANGKVRLLHSCELICPKLLRPFVEFHKAIFWVGDGIRTPTPFFESFPPII